jgi:hypothetical protein
VRAERGWKKARLIHELRAAAARAGEKLPKDESLERRIAIWENQGGAVSDFYRDLLCEIYGRSPADLGLQPAAVATVTEQSWELSERLELSRLDGGLIELLRRQTQNIRLLDRRLGGAAIHLQATAHVEQLDRLLRFALPGAHREAAADELGQAAALAGWQALNMGKLHDAWRLHEVAKAAARESESPAGLSYATAQQAYVLLDAGRSTEAFELISAIRRQAGTRVPPALRAWLSAAEGEVLAHLGDRDAALCTLDQAAAVLAATAGDDNLPYLMLDAGHLARWRGHCLAQLGHAAAIDSLTSALESMGEGQYGRAEASLRVDLAIALRARGDTTEARHQARLAAEIAGRSGSQRQRRRIADLLRA